MKILYYSELLNLPAGASVHGRMFLNAVKKQGVEITPYNLSTISDKASSSPLKYILIRLPSSVLEVIKLARSFFSSLFVSINLIKYHHEGRFDVILMRLHGMDWACMFTSKVLKIPLILEVNTPLSYEMGLIRKPGRIDLLRKYERLMWNKADHIITVSSILKTYLVNAGIGTSKISVVPNGVDLDKFNPQVIGDSNPEITNARENGDLILMFSGSPMPWHDSQILFDVLKLESDISLFMIGDSEYLRELKKAVLANSLEDKVHFLGHVPHEQMPSLLILADVLLATYKFQDFFYYSPLKIMEYMALGKPIIASALGQNIELLGDDCGFLVEPEDISQIREALSLLKSNAKLGIEAGNRARAKVEGKYSWDHNAKQILNIIDNVFQIYYS